MEGKGLFVSIYGLAASGARAAMHVRGAPGGKRPRRMRKDRGVEAQAPRHTGHSQGLRLLKNKALELDIEDPAENRSARAESRARERGKFAMKPLFDSNHAPWRIFGQGMALSPGIGPIARRGGAILGHRAAALCPIAKCDPRCEVQRRLGHAAGKLRLMPKPPPEPKPDDRCFDAEFHVGTL